jgi:hypothetical protein
MTLICAKSSAHLSSGVGLMDRMDFKVSDCMDWQVIKQTGGNGFL